jgi:hypothetical protein
MALTFFFQMSGFDAKKKIANYFVGAAWQKKEAGF